MKIGVALSKPIKLLRKFTKWLARDTKHAKVKNNAVIVNPTPTPTPTQTQTQSACCGICMGENISMDEMFSIPTCAHSYCLSCMSRHAKSMLRNGRLPKCPHDKCMIQLKVQSCEKFLSSELLELMRRRLIEANIPASDRIYCPNPKCSALFSKTQLIQIGCPNPKGNGDGAITPNKCPCPKCLHFICIDCKLPWHGGLKCHEYRRQNSEYVMVESLASQNLWRQCPNCSHMVSLESGCYHIYCRCGHEFCYICGAAWKDKKATCKCPVWDERNSERRRRRRR